MESNNKSENFEEEYLDDIEYVQAPSIKELEKLVRKKIEDYGTVEQNPFWDAQSNKWTQVVLYYNSEEENC